MASVLGNAENLLSSGRQTSVRLGLSYVLDWIVILVVAGVGGLLYKITGFTHAFSLEDSSISYPLVSDTVSITVVGIVACGVPAVVILVLSLLIPSSTIQASSQDSHRGTWGFRLWEWHAGWLGLALSLAGAFFITSGLKDVVGKPRPDFLARCDPDLSNVAAHVVGGLGLRQSSAAIMVSTGICQNTDASVVKNGFAAFPSGHSSFSFAGLLYLSLWLSAKFAVTFPIPFRAASRRSEEDAPTPSSDNHASFRSSAAAPPLYLLLLVLAPIAVALFICATRYADYMHAGWDIMGGSVIGSFFAWLGFGWYHISPRDGQSCGSPAWAWAPRSTRGAFGVPFGSPSFGRYEDAKREGRTSPRGYVDLELGRMS
ncbi:diacylglycerol pyrophosphate phosphatase [Penicillium hispanicum]|uniref:diacylglycerol pyrophosphate phosphatase n=1 Tax=Penicillium hispanicum TaxID=1080232 RepID=UPI002541A666|nr:diacylglycerol pyrophosphate phosphatase [Penicillium hispanicum]KAJ5579699.1 diacylglycerol pyrophosphate phosphatase [Penicillium hispanicum]